MAEGTSRFYLSEDQRKVFWSEFDAFEKGKLAQNVLLKDNSKNFQKKIIWESFVPHIQKVLNLKFTKAQF